MSVSRPNRNDTKCVFNVNFRNQCPRPNGLDNAYNMVKRFIVDGRVNLQNTVINRAAFGEGQIVDDTEFAGFLFRNQGCVLSSPLTPILAWFPPI
jgi:hypothetical protein